MLICKCFDGLNNSENELEFIKLSLNYAYK